jgi:fumarate reductase subunit D
MSQTPHVPPSSPPPGGSFTPPPPSGTAPSSERTIFLVLSYLGILSLIPLLAKKDDPEVQWHAKNGVALFLAELVWVAIRVALIFIRIPFVGCGMTMVSCVVWIGFLALSIVCIVKATQGQRFRIPIITDMAEKL